MSAQPTLEDPALLDDRGHPSRRWAELGVVRASDLAGRGATRFPGTRRRPERHHPAGPAATDPSTGPAGTGPAGTGPAGTGPEDGAGIERPAPASSEDAAVLPVTSALAGLLPNGGLRRGSAVAATGSTALVLALLAEASRAGSWCAVVGLPALGVQAAAEAGLDLARTALVPRPGPRAAAVVAALVDGVDVVVLGDAARWSAGDRQRLGARIRQRGAVLVPVGPPGVWPGAEAELGAVGGTWSGLGSDGLGRLHSRRVRVCAAARGRPVRTGTELVLPGSDGRCRAVERAVRAASGGRDAPAAPPGDASGAGTSGRERIGAPVAVVG